MTRPIAKINAVLESWASLQPPVIDFTVENVMAAIDYETSYDFVLSFLLSKQGFELEVNRMHLCNNNHKVHKSDLEEDLDLFLLPECHICGEELAADYEHSYLVFNFTTDFIQDAKKKVLLWRDHYTIAQ